MRGTSGKTSSTGGSTHLAGKTFEEKLLALQSPPETLPAKAGRSLQDLGLKVSAATSSSLTGKGREDGGPRVEPKWYSLPPETSRLLLEVGGPRNVGLVQVQEKDCTDPPFGCQ